MPSSTPSNRSRLTSLVLVAGLAASPVSAQAPALPADAPILQPAGGVRPNPPPEAPSPPVTSPPPAPDFERTARTETELGKKAYDLGRFEEAIAHYSAAYDAMPLPALLFNIGQCHRQLGQFGRASFFYGRYLDLAPRASNATLAHELLEEVGRTQLSQDPPAAELPLHRKWWFWAAAGAAALAAGGAVILRDPTAGAHPRHAGRTMSARVSKGPVLLCAWLCASLSACSPSTSLLLEIDPTEVPQTEQVRIVGRAGDRLLFGPTIRPDVARGPLDGVQGLRVLLPTSAEGAVTISVEGLVEGKVRAARSVQAEIRPGEEQRVPLRLRVAQPECGDCEGCCAGDKCVGRSLAACGAGGVACIECNPVLADQCTAEGRCACGTGPACGPELGADRCVNGQCRCGTGNPCGPGLRCDNGVCRCTPESCAGCCTDNACLSGNEDRACGAEGALCMSCAISRRCSAGQCVGP